MKEPPLWKTPHISKVYEALGAIADERMTLSVNTSRVYSSSRGKYYDVVYHSTTRAIMSNDNSAYFKDELSYPMIAHLMLAGEIAYDPLHASWLSDIAWKDLNVKNHNDFDATIRDISRMVSDRSGDFSVLERYARTVLDGIQSHPYRQLGKKSLPPEGY